MGKNKKLSEEDKLKMKIAKKISRDTFLAINTLTKVIKDKTVYTRKTKHRKP